MEELQRFHYGPFTDPARQMRLLRVVSTDESATGTLRCELTHWTIQEAPAYCAISYTWGDLSAMESMIINGKRAFIGKNCSYALSQARSFNLSSEQNHHIWIDSICINQADVQEKSHQVARIGSIYKNAAQVLACVGDAADDSDLLLRFLRQHVPELTRCSEKWAEKSLVDNIFQHVYRKWSLGYGKQSWQRLLRALQHLLERTYFSRVWVMQELFMGVRISICCGTEVAPMQTLHGFRIVVCQLRVRLSNRGHWADFKAALRTLKSKRGSNAGRQLYGEIESNNLSGNYLKLATRHNTDLLPLGEATYITFGMGCQDPRDKIYAISALTDWGQIEPVQADYSKGLFELAIETYEKLAALELTEFSPEYKDPSIRIGAALQLTAQNRQVAEALRRRRSSEESDIDLRPRHERSSLKKCSMFWFVWTVLFDGDGWRLDPRGSMPLGASTTENTHGRQFPRVEVFEKDMKVVVFLPPYVRHGDFLLAQGRFTASVGSDEWLGLVARPSANTHRNGIIGKAIIIGDIGEILPAFERCGYLMYDPEDLVALRAGEQQFPTWEGAAEVDMQEYLATRMCGSPGSSYAIVEQMRRYREVVERDRNMLIERWRQEGAPHRMKEATENQGRGISGI